MKKAIAMTLILIGQTLLAVANEVEAPRYELSCTVLEGSREGFPEGGFWCSKDTKTIEVKPGSSSGKYSYDLIAGGQKYVLSGSANLNVFPEIPGFPKDPTVGVGLTLEVIQPNDVAIANISDINAIMEQADFDENGVSAESSIRQGSKGFYYRFECSLAKLDNRTTYTPHKACK